MQLLRFKPERSSLRLQFRRRPNNHSKKMFGFAGFLPASSDVFQEFLFGNGVVGFDVVSADTSAGANQLSYDSSCYWIWWNHLCKIDNCFAESARSFFQIVNAFCLGFFAHKSCTIVPKRIIGGRIPPFRIRHSFDIRHSCFVIRSPVAVQFRIKPGPGELPVAPHGDGRNLEHLCDFVVAETAEIF